MKNSSGATVVSKSFTLPHIESIGVNPFLDVFGMIFCPFLSYSFPICHILQAIPWDGVACPTLMVL
jgi:hypothetical protein